MTRFVALGRATVWGVTLPSLLNRSDILAATRHAPVPGPLTDRVATPRVLIVERDGMARRGLGQALSNSAYLSGSVGTIQEAEYLSASTLVDVVLVGADVLDMDGAEGIDRLLTRFTHARVVVLVAEGSPELLVAALRRGADGVLPRDIMPDALGRAVRGVLHGEVAVPRRWVAFLAEAVRLGASTATIDDLALSPREREVLTELGRGRSNAQIARRLRLKESTVKTHVSNILRKTGVRSRFALQMVGRLKSACA